MKYFALNKTVCVKEGEGKDEEGYSCGTCQVRLLLLSHNPCFLLPSYACLSVLSQ